MLRYAGIPDCDRNDAVYLAYLVAMLMLVEIHNQASSPHFPLSTLDPVNWILGGGPNDPQVRA